MRTEIFYGGIPIFSGICPTPLLSRRDEFVSYGSRWGTVEAISLEGLITGCPNFSEMLEKQSVLLSGFSKNYQELTVVEDGETVYSQDLVFVKELNFSESNYGYILPFSIDLIGYPSGFFSGFYGVFDPVNSFSFSEQEGQIVSINHSVSAKGFNTSNSQTDALQNAINFCEMNSGISDIVLPNFISDSNISNSVLKTVSKNVDRLNGACSINESWDYDPVLGGVGLLRYSSSFGSGSENGIVKVDLAGNLAGGHNVSLDNLRNRMSAIDFYEIASGSYSSFFLGELNPKELSINIDESPLNNTINFNYSFDNDPRPNPYFEDSFSLSVDEISAEKIASLTVDFNWRGNCKCNGEAGWNELLDAANNFNYYQLAAEKNQYYHSGTFLKSSPLSSGISLDKNNCKVSVSVDFENLDLGLIPPEPLHSFDYNIQIKPAIPQYSARPTICKGYYSIYDLDFCNRAQFSINGSSTVKPCGDLASGALVTKCMIEQIASKYVSGEDIIITSQSFNRNLGGNGREMSFSYSWSSKIDPIFPSGTLYV